VPDVPLNASEILAYLNEVAGALPPAGPRHTIVVVGGSLLALHGLRQSTLDVDTLARIEAELADAVAAVARVHDLAPAWLNDASASFRPQTFVQADCDVLLERPRLLGQPSAPWWSAPLIVNTHPSVTSSVTSRHSLTTRAAASRAHHLPAVKAITLPCWF